MIKPPKDVPPARLFSTLAEPKPMVAIDLEFRDPSTKHYCRALLASEWRMIGRGAEAESAVISASLCDVEGRPILSFADALRLPVTELRRIGNAIAPVVEWLSPRFSHIDYNSWRTAMRDGARECLGLAYRIGGCYDSGFSRTVDRPDRYFGMPLHELNDGHWLAYRVSREVYEEAAQ